MLSEARAKFRRDRADHDSRRDPRARVATKIALPLLLAFENGSAVAANWEDWRLGISPHSCTLSKSYYIPSQDLRDERRRGFLSNSPYTGTSVRFDVPTGGPDPGSSADDARRVRFVAQIVPGPDVTKEHLIVRVDIGDFTLDTRYGLSNRNHRDDFALSTEQTRVMLDRFEANEPQDLTYHLANGQRLSSTLYPAGNENFFVWRKVFETCAEVNKP